MNSQVLPAPASRADVLPLGAAAKRVGLGRAPFTAWCMERGIVREIAGRRRVIWGDVLDAMSGGSGSAGAAPVVRSRDTLPSTPIRARR